MRLLKVSSEKLLLIAGIVWSVAGLNIAFIGLTAYLVETGWLVWALVGATLAVFVLFHVFVFTKMVGKHAERIRGFDEDRTYVFKFFDRKGYLMMAIMMAVGIGLRASGLVPDWFIAFFYTGLGLALVAVSYTHLDVYKRQIWRSARASDELICAKRLASGRGRGSYERNANGFSVGSESAECGRLVKTIGWAAYGARADGPGLSICFGTSSRSA